MARSQTRLIYLSASGPQNDSGIVTINAIEFTSKGWSSIDTFHNYTHCTISQGSSCEDFTQHGVVLKRALASHNLSRPLSLFKWERTFRRCGVIWLSTQYNALMDLASEAGTYQFSPQWPGPPVRQFLPWGQLAALEVLNAVIGLANDTSERWSFLDMIYVFPGPDDCLSKPSDHVQC